MANDAADLIHNPEQPTASRVVAMGRTELGDITVETGPPPAKVRKGGSGAIFAELVEKASKLKGEAWLRIPVIQTDDRATDRALTAVRRVIRERFGKASEGNDLKATALANGDLMLKRAT